MAYIVKDRVKETSTTTGTGSLTLAGALVGCQSFADACTVGDTFYYAIEGVDATGGPTGQWEIGLGTYSDVNTLARTTIITSSDYGSKLSLSAGTKHVYLTFCALQAAWPRDRMTLARNYYVRTDGNDQNTGLANTAAAAFLTIQRAVDVARSLDLGNYGVTIRIAAGTYPDYVTLKSYIGEGPITIQGEIGNPTGVILNPSGNVFIAANVRGKYFIRYLHARSATKGVIAASGPGTNIEFQLVDFGACANSHISATDGACVTAVGAYSIAGGCSAGAHFYAATCGIIKATGIAVTMAATYNFASGFVHSDKGLGMIDAAGMTFSGTATGLQFNLAKNAICHIAASNVNYFPGNTAGTLATGAVCE